MKNKKNIDQLFKERFEQFEATPPPHVWENIQAQLQEKKKDSKVIPLWWKVAGVAAVLALMFTIGSSVYDNSNKHTIVDVNSEKAEDVIVENEHSPLINKDKKNLEINNQQEVAEKGNKETLKSTTPATSKKTSKIKTAIDGVATTVNGNASNDKSTQNAIHERAVSTFDTNSNNSNITKNKEAIANNATTTIQNNTTSKNEELKNNSVIEEGVALNTTSVIKDETKPAIKDIVNPGFKKENEIKNPALPSGKSDIVVAQENISEENKEAIDENKKSIFDAINEQNRGKAEDAVAKNDVPKNRWEVAPNFAPVYYNTLTEGSSIDASFSDNSQSGDVNFSYGVGVSYAVTDRLSIRSGISNVDLSYSTSGIELGNGPIDVALRSVNYDRSQGVLIPQDKGTIAAQNPEGGFNDITLKSTNGEAFLNQNISYYEVPLELKYALLNKKIGVNLIGGMSTLFLGNNEVSVTAGDFNETLGAANNLSNVSFSTNVGLGFDYKLSSKFKFNVEPMFKYQLNPYTDTSVDFRPYYLGVYTGLSFKF